MSKYRVGQKLNVMVESIDSNGKAHFRVMKEEINNISTSFSLDKYKKLVDYRLMQQEDEYWDRLQGCTKDDITNYIGIDAEELLYDWIDGYETGNLGKLSIPENYQSLDKYPEDKYVGDLTDKYNLERVTERIVRKSINQIADDLCCTITPDDDECGLFNLNDD